MPTGYTYDVVEGKLTEFPKFAARCARAFGALVLLRDEELADVLPDSPGEEDDYEERALEKDEQRLSALSDMSDAEASAAAIKEHEEKTETERKYRAKCDEENARIESMIAKVNAWEPPSENHVGMKTFMLEQLTISKNEGSYYYKVGELLSGPEWKLREITRLRSIVAQSRVRIAEKANREDGRKLWLEQLRASLSSIAD